MGWDGKRTKSWKRGISHPLGMGWEGDRNGHPMPNPG
jgi:hypothetical protein